jgi:hypothetical protein
MSDFSILVVDEFLRLNGLEDSLVDCTRDQLLDITSKLKNIYGDSPEIVLCSDFMRSEEYSQTFQPIKRQIESDSNLADLVLQSVPENKRNMPSARDYPLHEFACVKYFLDRGFSLKIGPSKEKVYDRVMQMLGFQIDFEYLLDAYALGTKSPDKVVHYVPNSKGSNNGQRIFFGEDERIVKAKLRQGCDEALRYFCKIASVSGYLLGQRYLATEEISKLYGRKLKRETIELVLDNIIKPYQEVD